MVTLIGIVLPYVAVVVFVIGVSFRLITWMGAPKVLNWKLYPAPVGMFEEAKYILGEWLSFKMLLRNNRIIWPGSYGFHLALVGLGFWFLFFLLGLSVPWLLRGGAILMLASCVYLVVIRILIPQMRHVSTFAEFFHLALFLLIGLSGLALLGKGLAHPARDYYLGLLSLRPISPPSDTTFLFNLFLLEFVLAYLPFSKMFHMASKYFTYHKLRWRNPYELSPR